MMDPMSSTRQHARALPVSQSAGTITSSTRNHRSRDSGMRHERRAVPIAANAPGGVCGAGEHVGRAVPGVANDLSLLRFIHESMRSDLISAKREWRRRC